MPWIENGILSGVDKIIFEQLNGDEIGKPPHYDKTSFCRSLTDPSLKDFDVRGLIKRIGAQIVLNYGKPGPARSKQNWRWEPKRAIAKSNESQEVRIEKAIVNISPAIWPQVLDWSNQVPTSSGLLGPKSDRKRAIDLVHRWHDGEYVDYEFIELKVGSNNPVFAAMEVMLYGMLYVLSRDNREEMQYVRELNPLLWARDIHLKVLAPHKYYDGYNLGGFEKALDEALGDFLEGRGFGMDFEFQEFPQDFDPRHVLEDISFRDCQILEALSHRKPVYLKQV
jgi:hypothetical protein